VKIAFIGDVHGCVLHALGVLVALQRHRGIRLDAAIQVGDLGAYPTAERMDDPSRRFAAENPAQGDFFRLLDPSPELSSAVRGALEQAPPVLFVSGNHEDFDWLARLHQAHGASVVAVDPLGAIRHAECGHLAVVAGQRVAFLGRIESPGYMDLEAAAYASLLATEPGSVDILVTHDGPYGLCQDGRGRTEGSAKLARLVAHLQPRFHVSGHYHHPKRPAPLRPHPLLRPIPACLPKSEPVAPRPGQPQPTGRAGQHRPAGHAGRHHGVRPRRMARRGVR
jgi:Icc-related predicted phosphoesterase